MSGPLSWMLNTLTQPGGFLTCSFCHWHGVTVTASRPAVVESPNTFDQVIASNRQTVLVNHFRPGVAHRRLTASRGEGMTYHREGTKPQSATVENWLAKDIVQPWWSCPMICRWLAKLRLKFKPWKKQQAMKELPYKTLWDDLPAGMRVCVPLSPPQFCKQLFLLMNSCSLSPLHKLRLAT